MRRLGPLLLASIVTVASCNEESSDEIRADLCGDLGNLGPTIALLVEPPAHATVGELRGALEKLDPTVGDLEESDLVAEHLLQSLLDARAGYRIALKPFGDDEPGSEAVLDAAGSAIDLGVTTTEVMDELGCGQLTAES